MNTKIDYSSATAKGQLKPLKARLTLAQLKRRSAKIAHRRPRVISLR